MERSNQELARDVDRLERIMSAHIDDCAKHRAEVARTLAQMHDYQVKDDAERHQRQRHADEKERQQARRDKWILALLGLSPVIYGAVTWLKG